MLMMVMMKMTDDVGDDDVVDEVGDDVVDDNVDDWQCKIALQYFKECHCRMWKVFQITWNVLQRDGG